MSKPFRPNGSTKNIDVAASSSSVLVGSPETIRIMNDGTATVWVEFGIGSHDGRGPIAASVSRAGAVLTVTMSLNGATSLSTNTGATTGLTGWQASTSSTFGSLLTISSVTIDTVLNTITITLSADPGAPVFIRNYALYDNDVTVWPIGNYANIDRDGNAGTIEMMPTVIPLVSN